MKGARLHIGITYDLRTDYLAAGYSLEDTAEFDSAETIAAIESALRRMGHETERIGHVGRLRARLAVGARWGMVFNIAEGLWGADREARVPALLEGCGVPYTFSGSRVLTAGLHKGMSKRLARRAEVRTADFEVVASPENAEQCGLPMPLFVKPLAEGSSKGITAANVVASRSALVRRCGELLARYRQPVLVETYLPGREFTVGIVGTGGRAEVLGVMEVLCGDGAEPGGIPTSTKSTSRRAYSMNWRRTRRHGEPGRWRCGCGAIWGAGTPDGWTCAATRTASRIFWRSTHWRGCIRDTRTCPFCAAWQGLGLRG